VSTTDRGKDDASRAPGPRAERPQRRAKRREGGATGKATGTRPAGRRGNGRAARPPDGEQQAARPAPDFSPEARALVDEFAATEPFPLDPFQIEAARHLAEGRSVLVAAPTGTGKTVVAEFAIWH
jgi:hypothetical protein